MKKHDYDKILKRLVVILQKLNDGEALSVKELANEFNVSTKTIQRDFNDRLAPSFPIYQDKRLWKFQYGYKLEKSKDIEEQLILDILEKVAENFGYNFANKSKTLISKIKNETFNPIYTKLNIEDIGNKLSEIKLLEEAISLKKEIKCDYKIKDSYTTVLQPLKIVNFEGFWYLIALRKEKIRKYYLKNILNIKILDIIFKVDTKIEDLLKNSISIWFNENIEPFEVKLLANKDIAKYFKRKPFPTQKIIKEYDDGSIEFSINITNEYEIIPRVSLHKGTKCDTVLKSCLISI